MLELAASHVADPAAHEPVAETLDAARAAQDFAREIHNGGRADPGVDGKRFC
ncbi:hypothetical protein [Bowdeniella nasicola]|uniref:hypothetical protein n=1 Tax=Bowdeniella nasicola TaxID=208480 RepID=UPI001FE68EFE|nr:hypothetical protein [Bowdeniella nasicola]